MEAVNAANLGLRFLLELCLLGALAAWGFQTGTGRLARFGLGIGVPIFAAVVWGIFLAPASDSRLPVPWRSLLELILFGAAAAGLAVTGHRVLAVVFALLVVGNAALMWLWEQ